jgi:hypothetical protein
MSRAGRVTLFLLPGIIILSIACGSPTEEPAPPAAPTAAAAASVEALDRAKAAVNAMGAVLTSTLLEELQKGGPAQAVRVCSEVAPALAAEQSTQGLVIRLISLQARNPADRPDDYERAVLQTWASRLDEGLAPEAFAETVEEEGRTVLRYMRPIMIMAPCLACHGDPAAMSPELQAVLEERYPDDEAVGYTEGDLRGAFTVIVEMD